MIARENKRKKLVEHYRKQRAELKAIVGDVSLDYDERMQAQMKLQKLPRASSVVRYTRRCSSCGRPKAVYRKFGLCRICLRKHLMNGEVAGGRKSSW
ncbi:MAG: 30S ribosomal protein S14 [Legionellales bacterium]|nr:30S ribosomal protein S14 [Legionellales bacterium]